MLQLILSGRICGWFAAVTSATRGASLFRLPHQLIARTWKFVMRCCIVLSEVIGSQSMCCFYYLDIFGSIYTAVAARLPNTRKIMEVWYCCGLQVARAGSNFFLHSFFDTISQALTENGMETGSFPSFLLWPGFLERRVSFPTKNSHTQRLKLGDRLWPGRTGCMILHLASY